MNTSRNHINQWAQNKFAMCVEPNLKPHWLPLEMVDNGELKSVTHMAATDQKGIGGVIHSIYVAFSRNIYLFPGHIITQLFFKLVF